MMNTMLNFLTAYMNNTSRILPKIEKGLVELRLKKDVAKGKEKKVIAETIKKQNNP